MIRLSSFHALAFLLLGFTACSARLDVYEIPTRTQTTQATQPTTAAIPTPEPPAASEPHVDSRRIPGIPFRMKRPHTLRILQLQPDGQYKQVAKFHKEFADTSRLFALNMKGAPLSDHTMKFALNEDGTLKNVDLATASKLDEGLTALGEQAKAVATAAEAAETKRDAADAARRQAERDAAKALEDQTRATEDAYLAAVAARHSVEALEAQLAAVLDGSALGDADNLRRQIAEAKILADTLYRRAGLPPPYGTIPRIPPAPSN